MEPAAPRPRRPRLPHPRTVVVLVGIGLLSACRAPHLVVPDAAALPPGLPPFAGPSNDFRAVSDLLFVARRDLDAWQEGRVATRSGLRATDEPFLAGTPAEAGYRLRTAHVSLSTNAPWSEAVRLAALAERHVRLLFGTLGGDLDLVFPAAPLDVVVHATRADYQAALALAVPGHHGWTAWYDDRTRTVHACLEPAPRGSLPLEADLRHEMTHQILDGSTPRAGRPRIPEGHGFWLWEGIAVWAETLGDAPTDDTRAPRRARFLKRAAQRELTPLARLVRLAQDEFLGRHYDQVGMLLDHLMAGGVPGGRRAVLDSLRDVLHADWEGDPFPDRVGLSYAALERQWLNAVVPAR